MQSKSSSTIPALEKRTSNSVNLKTTEKKNYYASAARASSLLWWAGFKDALCLHRCVVYFVHNPDLLAKTGYCFALNGLIFLGSIVFWEFALSPGIKHLLVFSLHSHTSPKVVEYLHTTLCSIFGALWLVPVYLVSFLFSCVWYQEIAEGALKVMREKDNTAGNLKSSKTKQDLSVQIAQELFRAVLFFIFLLQTFVVGIFPWIGGLGKFVLLSWLNALYSFDYKWSLSKQLSLQERIRFFERHWAYFAGFGSVCTLATACLPFFSGAAISATIYPLFILVACDSDPIATYKKVSAKEEAAGRSLHISHLPIFMISTRLTTYLMNPRNLKLLAWFRSKQ